MNSPRLQSPVAASRSLARVPAAERGGRPLAASISSAVQLGPLGQAGARLAIAALTLQLFCQGAHCQESLCDDGLASNEGQPLPCTYVCANLQAHFQLPLAACVFVSGNTTGDILNVEQVATWELSRLLTESDTFMLVCVSARVHARATVPMRKINTADIDAGPSTVNGNTDSLCLLQPVTIALYTI